MEPEPTRRTAQSAQGGKLRRGRAGNEAAAAVGEERADDSDQVVDRLPFTQNHLGDADTVGAAVVQPGVPADPAHAATRVGGAGTARHQVRSDGAREITSASGDRPPAERNVPRPARTAPGADPGRAPTRAVI